MQLTANSGKFSPFTFAMGGLNHPGAVEVVGVEVRKARRQNGARVSLNIPTAEGWGKGSIC